MRALCKARSLGLEREVRTCCGGSAVGPSARPAGLVALLALHKLSCNSVTFTLVGFLAAYPPIR